MHVGDNSIVYDPTAYAADSEPLEIENENLRLGWVQHVASCRVYKQWVDVPVRLVDCVFRNDSGNLASFHETECSGVAVLEKVSILVVVISDP